MLDAGVARQAFFFLAATAARMTDLTARLASLVADAIAITLDDPAAAGLDETQVMDALRSACAHDKERPADLLPVLEQLLARLDAALAHARDGLEREASRYRFSIMKWRPEMPAMPRAVTAFVARDTLRRTQGNCVYYLAEAHYQALRRPGDRCDCAARIAAGFLYHEPEAPLETIDHDGAAYPLAMDTLHRCTACGTRWHQAEAMDDRGTWSTWTVAPADATKA